MKRDQEPKIETHNLKRPASRLASRSLGLKELSIHKFFNEGRKIWSPVFAFSSLMIPKDYWHFT